VNSVDTRQEPILVQGGMGAGISSWRLASAVAKTGQLGVVSGTALEQILVRRLADGDPGGHMRRALAAFPSPEIAARIVSRYYVEAPAANASYPTLPLQGRKNPRELQELCIAGNFVEVFLAREGHANPVGINYLEKIQIPHLPSIYGAMLAGVGYVFVGAGVPLSIPGVLERFTRHEAATYSLAVSGADDADDVTLSFDPREFVTRDLPPLKRPRFIAIVSSNVLAATLLKKADGPIDGFVIEGATAGGHNAPPRGKLRVDEDGEPIYGERDVVDLAKIRELGVPFWLAGSYGTPEKVRDARAAGAAGVQVGTPFAFAAESDLRDDYKREVLEQAVRGEARVATDVLASPTGFPFKVVALDRTLSDPGVYAARPRICDLGFLREAYRQADGAIGFRCPSEPVNLYVAKGGRAEETVGRKCICNALLATIGHPQHRKGGLVEPGIVTSGRDLNGITRFMPPGGVTYTAADVVRTLLG
jgi:nitronate monooxygenase